jgi:hypothetical protein
VAGIVPKGSAIPPAFVAVRREHLEHAETDAAMRFELRALPSLLLEHADVSVAKLVSRREDGHAGARVGRARREGVSTRGESLSTQRKDVSVLLENLSLQGEGVSVLVEDLSLQGEDLSVRAEDPVTLRNHGAA